MQITWLKPPEEALFKFNNMENKKQVFVYVDGYNFYYGLRQWWCKMETPYRLMKNAALMSRAIFVES